MRGFLLDLSPGAGIMARSKNPPVRQQAGCSASQLHPSPLSCRLHAAAAGPLACHGHLQTLAPSPATKSWRYRGSCGFAQSTWGRAGSGERGGHGRPGDTLPGGAARSGLTRSRERLGCMGERPEASLVHPSQGGKPGTLGTGVGVREKGCRENTPFPSFLQLSLK